jgi:hypothetical protein
LIEKTTTLTFLKSDFNDIKVSENSKTSNWSKSTQNY